MPKPTLTTESGAPVADNQRVQTAGPAGPVLLQDQHLIEKLARFNRERIPERIVHARGSAAYGTFEVTADVTALHPGPLPLVRSGKRTETFARFSTVAGGRGRARGGRATRAASPSSSTPRTATTTWSGTTPRSSSSATRSSSPTSSTPRSPTPSPTTRSRTTSGTSSPTHPKPPTCSPGSSATAASRRRTATWTATAPTPSSGSTPTGDRFWVKYHLQAATRASAASTGARRPTWPVSTPKSTSSTWSTPSSGATSLVDAEGADHARAEAATYRINPFDLTKVWPHGTTR